MNLLQPQGTTEGRNNMEKQSRMQSPIFWIGLVACIYQAVIGSLIGGSVELDV